MKKNIILAILLSSCVSKAPAFKQPDIVRKASKIEQKDAILTHYADKKIKISFDGIKHYKTKQETELNILQQIVAKKTAKFDVKQKSDLIVKINNLIKKEAIFIDEFNQKVSKLEGKDFEEFKVNKKMEEKVYFPVKFNKVNLMLANALAFEKKNDILFGKFIKETFKQKTIPVFSNEDSLSNSSITTSTITLLSAVKILDEKEYQKIISKHSSLFFKFNTSYLEALSSGSIFNSNGNIVLVHNGYAFGGSINSEYYNKSFKTKQEYLNYFFETPHDCAEFVSFLMKEDVKEMQSIPFNPNFFTGVISNLKEYQDNKTYSEYLKDSMMTFGILNEYFDITILDKSTLNLLNEGDVIYYRRLKSKDDKIGVAGHTFLYLKQTKDKLIGLNYDRDLEKFGSSGALISTFDKSELSQEKMWFVVRKKS